MTQRKMAPICRVLGISRACAYRESVGRPARSACADDRTVTAQIRVVIRTRASHGARRVRALVGADIQQLMRRAVTTRCGAGERPDVPMQWLRDNGSIYTALDTHGTAERLHLVPMTTPAASPPSNGMSEALVNTRRRDDLAGADRSTAAVILDQIPTGLADDNAVAPHSALGYQVPQQYRSTMITAGS